MLNEICLKKTDVLSSSILHKPCPHAGGTICVGGISLISLLSLKRNGIDCDICICFCFGVIHSCEMFQQMHLQMQDIESIGYD
jgi:hypothetical protein